MVQVFDATNREAENWLKSIMSPMETQVREHQMQLRRRLESVKRIHKAADTLGNRILELDQVLQEIRRQLRELDVIEGNFTRCLDEGLGVLARAAA